MGRVLAVKLVVLLALLTSSPAHSSAGVVAKRPNIVLILADDQGWTGSSVSMVAGQENSRSDYFKTPNLEALASRSMVFSDAYSPSPICSPSRYGIQFGISPAQLHKTSNDYKGKPRFRPKSIAEVLKSIDPSYAAAHFGKWHIYNSPEEFGYDESDGATSNKQGGNQGGSDVGALPLLDPKLMFSLTDRSLAFMEREVARSRPFFLQISHYAIHTGLQARQATLFRLEGIPRGTIHTSIGYAAMIADLDVAVGRVIDKIDELGIANNTYIFYTSDNGGLARNFPRMNYPLRGGKASFFEGGLRVPLLVSGPGVASSSHCGVPTIGLDLLPTFADLAGGAELPRRVEGGSLRGVLENRCRGEVKRPRDGLYFFAERGAKAVIRLGNLKLRTDWKGGPRGADRPVGKLYDLSNDISESHDLAASAPEQVILLETRLLEWLEEINAKPTKSAKPKKPRSRSVPSANR